jgi:hypothetical protein
MPSDEVTWLSERIGIASASKYEQERGKTHCIVTRHSADSNTTSYTVALDSSELFALAAHITSSSN